MTGVVKKRAGQGGRGRPPQIENAPDRASVLEMLLDPYANLTAISRRTGYSVEALTTFRARWITPAMREMLDRAASSVPLETMQLDVMARLANIAAKAEKMLAAADAWLEDPNAPGKYNLNPRTHEVEIVFEEAILGSDPPKTKRKTEKLAKLMADVEKGLGISIVKGETRTADPRNLILETVDTLKPVLELIGKASGQIRPERIDVAVAIAQATPEQLAGTPAFQSWWDGFEARLRAEGVSAEAIDRALGEPKAIEAGRG